MTQTYTYHNYKTGVNIHIVASNISEADSLYTEITKINPITQPYVGVSWKNNENTQ